MPQKMMAPNTTLVWVPISGVVDPYNPTITELNAGTNISTAVVRGYKLNPNASDTDKTSAITDEGNVDNRTYSNYEGSLTFFRDANIQDNLSSFNKAWALFRRAGARGYLYRRVGKKNIALFVIGDECEGFLFESDWPQTLDGDSNGGPVQFTVPFLQQGSMTGQVYCGPLLPPTVTSATPSTGLLQAGGQPVDLVGTNFYGVISVTVGGVPASGLVVTTSTTLRFNSPASSTGAKPIVVTTPGGASDGSTTLTYV